MTSPTGRLPDNRPAIQNIRVIRVGRQAALAFAKNYVAALDARMAAAVGIPQRYLHPEPHTVSEPEVPPQGAYYEDWAWNVMHVFYGTGGEVGRFQLTTSILRPTPMLHALPPLVKARRRNMVWCAPKLVLDEVTKQLSWENERYRDRYERELIARTEMQMLGYVGTTIGFNTTEDIGFAAIYPKALKALFAKRKP